jgi:hypothetical protein
MSTIEKTKNYVNALKRNNNQPNKSENEKKKHSKLDCPNHANKYETRMQQMLESYQFGKQSPTPSSKLFIPRHPNFFYGYCFYCGNFGHKVVSCRTFRYNRNVGMILNKPKIAMVQNYFNNSFSPLLNELEFHICNNFGHKASECRSNMLSIFKKDKQENFTKIWRKKNKNK